MFYDCFSRLCARKGVSTSRAAEDIHLSRSTVSKWKTGSVPSGATLQKIAKYFDVSADYLLRGEQLASKTAPHLTLDDFTYALCNETKELTPEQKQRLLELAREFKKEQEREEKGK